MHRLKNMKENLMCCVQAQMSNLSNVDTTELGAAVDMIKDLSEAIYYCTITEAMEKNDKEKEHQPQPMYMMMNRYPDYNRDMDRGNGRMYYNGDGRGRMPMYADGGIEYYPIMYATGGGNTGGSSSNSGGGNNGGNSSSGSGGGTAYYPLEMRDYREGRSPMSRKMYMESKEMHHDKAKQMKELENYMHELSQDITEMIQDASQEEKQMLQQKISVLAGKIK